MVQFEQDYLLALPGLALGFLGGLVVSSRGSSAELRRWDGRATVALLAAAAVAHAALIPKVELMRVVLLSLYGAALVVTIVAALAGVRFWRLAAVLLPAGSIAGYVYFAAVAHETDVVGLIVKLVEIGAIAAALAPILLRRRAESPLAGRWLA